jgi:hypothetical protein
MIKTLSTAFVVLAFSVATSAVAAPCKDAKGKFTKCPAPAAKQVCKDAKGKFAKCGTPGAVAVVAKKK